MVSAVRCERCRVGHCLPEDASDDDAEWACGRCDARVQAKEVQDKVRETHSG